ncbi:MAG TPA: M20/M25/M40 family metallo-hydrolase [Rhizomicrobium sp.]|nr:M20/M25/M40 family metallo-hydrolase [Rhizomicrobium sp.]
MSLIVPGADRRTVLMGAAAATTLLMSRGAAFAADDMADLKKAIADGHAATIKRLQDWIGHPSIAAENRDMQEGAKYMMQLALDAGFQHAEVVQTSGAPGVFATYDVGAPKTLGLYFMYDVKQYNPSEWSSPPLEGRIVDRPGMGKVCVGRGATNQKGPENTFLAALHAMKAAGRKLPVNLVLVAEGEEEIGSPHFHEIVQRPDILAALKKSVGVILPMNGQGPTGEVAINLGAKGVMEIELVSSGAKWGRGPSKDLHSSYKAAVDSPVWHLIEALATLVTPDGNKPAVEGWYEHVKPLTQHQKDLIHASVMANNEAVVMKSLNVSHWIDDLSYEKAMDRLAEEPTINIEGIFGGYTGPGGKTILPSMATAKLDCRIVPDQTVGDLVPKLKAHLKKHGFGDIEVNVTGAYNPTQTDENSALIQSEITAYKSFGLTPHLNPRLAGSWPGVVFTGAPVGLPAGQFGMGYGTGAHAPDEFYLVESTNPKIWGMDDATLAYAQFLYQIAASA